MHEAETIIVSRRDQWRFRPRIARQSCWAIANGNQTLLQGDYLELIPAHSFVLAGALITDSLDDGAAFFYSP